MRSASAGIGVSVSSNGILLGSPYHPRGNNSLWNFVVSTAVQSVFGSGSMDSMRFSESGAVSIALYPRSEPMRSRVVSVM